MLKSVHICQSYRKNKSATFCGQQFMPIYGHEAAPVQPAIIHRREC